MIDINTIEIDHIYTCGDDALYLVVSKGSDWVLFLSYSFNHGLANPYLVNSDWFNDDYIQNNWSDVTSNIYSKDIFDNLKYSSSDTLRYECD